MAFAIKARRIFSKEFKLDIVKQIESGKIRILDVSRNYDVNLTSVYNWVNQYSRNLKKGEAIVVQKESEELRNLELRKRIAELERIVGQKQMEVDFLNKVIELGSQEIKLDIKKKFGGKLSSGSGSTDGIIRGK